MTERLPRMPSQLIRVALHDLEEAEKDKRYVVGMSTYHVQFDSRCIVCAAGAVMAFSLGAPRGRDLGPDDFAEGNKLRAIDCLRRGDVGTAMSRLGLSGDKLPQGLHQVAIPEYAESPTHFKIAMERLAFELESYGY